MKENKEKLQHILSWVKILGDKVGAYEQYFRFEAQGGDARALPPKGKDRTPVFVEFSDEEGRYVNKPNDLRLYCYRANESVVFLFNGDVKTADTPQECKNVRPHFALANKLSKIIDEKFISEEIRWINDYIDIEFDNDLILELD